MCDIQTCTHALSSLLVNDQSPWERVPARPGTQPDPGLGWRRRRDVSGGIESVLGPTSRPSLPEGQELLVGPAVPPRIHPGLCRT